MTKFNVLVGGIRVGTVHHYTWFEALATAVKRYGQAATVEES